MVLPLPGRPTMRVMAFPGSPPSSTASSDSWPLSSRSLMGHHLAGRRQERARSEKIPHLGYELQRLQRFPQKGIRPRVQGLVLAFQHRNRDDRHVVILLERTAETETGPARYQQFDHDERGGAVGERPPGGFLAQGYFDFEALGLQEVLLQFGGVGVMLGKQDEEPGLASAGGSHCQPGLEPLCQQAVSIRRTQSVGHLRPHEPELLDLIPAEQPVPARVPVGDDECVTVFPRADGGHRNTQHARYRTDAVDRTASSLHHPYPTYSLGKANTILGFSVQIFF